MSQGLHDQISANKRRSVVLVAAFAAVVVVGGWALGLVLRAGDAGAAVALAMAATAGLGAWWKSDAIALARSNARPAAGADHARLHNLVEGLCIAGGLPKPRLYVVPDDAPNAFATGRNPRHGAVVVTTGLLEKLNRVELEGVLAHELSHIKNYDTLVSSMAVALVGEVSAGHLLPLALGRRRRELLADVSGVTLTRYPPGLISALEKLRDDTAVVHSGSRATAHLWIESPNGIHPPLDERISALREL